MHFKQTRIERSALQADEGRDLCDANRRESKARPDVPKLQDDSLKEQCQIALKMETARLRADGNEQSGAKMIESAMDKVEEVSRTVLGTGHG